MLNEPRMATALGFWALAIVLGGIARMMRDDQGIIGGIRFILACLALMFLVAAIVQSVDVVTYRAANRIREFQLARVQAITATANAIERLTTGKQLELVETMGFTTMSLVPGDLEPVLFVDVPGGRVPHETVTDFLRQSVETAPYLMPVRRGGQPWRDAVLITSLLIAHGWAEKASGPHAARLTVPIEKVAAALWVELDIPEIV